MRLSNLVVMQIWLCLDFFKFFLVRTNCWMLEVEKFHYKLLQIHYFKTTHVY